MEMQVSELLKSSPLYNSKNKRAVLPAPHSGKHHNGGQTAKKFHIHISYTNKKKSSDCFNFFRSFLGYMKNTFEVITQSYSVSALRSLTNPYAQKIKFHWWLPSGSMTSQRSPQKINEPGMVSFF